MKKIKVSWNEYDKLVKVLCNKLPKDTYDYVVAIPWGANVPAGRVAQYLNVPLEYYFYHHDKDQLPSGTPLLVDELVDSGYTINKIHNHIGIHDLAVLHTKIPKLSKYYAQQIPRAYPWIQYPWERNDKDVLSKEREKK